MKKIGIVVAVEMFALINKLGEAHEVIKENNYEVLVYRNNQYEIYAVRCGMGEIASSACTQLLISLFKVDYIFNFGIVGGLKEEMAKEKLCIVEKIVHYDFDTSEIDDCEPARYLELEDIWIPTSKELLDKALEAAPNLKKVICASADKFIYKREDKERISSMYDADICEMEAAGIALTCYRNNIPCLLIKAVSDGLDDGADEYYSSKEGVSQLCFDIFLKVIEYISKEYSC